MQSLSEYYERAPNIKTVPPCDVSSRTICTKNRMGLFAKKGETIRSKIKFMGRFTNYSFRSP